MNGTTIELPVDAVRVVMELYPRTETREINSLIEQYRDAIDDLPPITVARGGILVDGLHRWQAHRREQRPTIKAIDLGNLSDAEIYDAALELNAKHGRQLSRKEKRSNAARLWVQKTHLEPGERLIEIARRLGISKDVVYDATKEQRQYEKEAQQARAWDLWLDCLTQEQIAAEVGVPQQTISGWLTDFRQVPKIGKPPASRQHFDVWDFGKADGESSYFGKLPPQVIENLLWLYTEPGQMVVDPFAGGGTTIDVAKRMGRRVWASDRQPSTPTLPIHQHDIRDGWPGEAPNKAQCILLDPPYWQQAKGRYSDSPDDLANMALKDFYATWADVLCACVPHLADGGVLAYIISPTQCEDGRVVDHATDMLRACWDAGLRVKRRIIVPYQTQQATGQQVTWAREQRCLLKRYRDLVILERANG